MTEANYLDIDPREETPSATSRLFSFLRVRGAAETRFFPGRGTRLHFASKAVDTLECVGVPVGFLVKNDKVKVRYKGTTVFLGVVESRSTNYGRGDDATENVVCTGPWSDMSRLVFRQNWSTGSAWVYSSRLILNQARTGEAQDLNHQLLEMAQYGAQSCGYTAPQSVNVSGQYLPFDECRDVTVADAIRRELRFFPKTIVRFDYSTDPPTLVFARPGSGADAAYVASVPKTARQYQYTAHPITGVDLEIETVGNGYRAISHQTAGNTAAGNPDCLYATIQLAGATGSTVTQSLQVTTETIPANLNDTTWWKTKHPRLKNVDANQITITNGARSGESDKNNYPRIAANSAGELQSAGISCRVEQFSCKCKISGGYDNEEEIELTMNFLTTNATTKKYTWVVSSESTAGETVPEGLAAAILADRSGELKSEKMMLRLGDSMPVLGDRCDGLFLQTFDVDCCTLLAELSFGTPDYLAPEDMAALLSGFRNKCRPSTSFSRSTGKPADDKADKVEMGGIPPLSSTEWAPGKTTKKTIHAPAQSNAGSIELDPSSLDSGCKVEIHDLTVGENTYKVLADDDIKIPAPGGSSVVTDGKSTEFIPHDNTQGANNDDEGKLQIYGFKSAATAAATANEGGTLAARLAKDTAASAMAVPVKTSGGLIQWIKLGQIAKMTLVEGTNITLTTSQDGKSIVISASATPNVTGATRTLLLGGPVSYDPSTHYLTQPVYSLVISGGLVTSITDQTSVSIQAVEETT